MRQHARREMASTWKTRIKPEKTESEAEIGSRIRVYDRLRPAAAYTLLWTFLQDELQQLPDTSATRHFGPAWDTSAPKNVVRDTSASYLRKVRILWAQDNSDKTQLHRWFGLKLVPKCLGAEMSCGRSVRLPLQQVPAHRNRKFPLKAYRPRVTYWLHISK